MVVTGWAARLGLLASRAFWEMVAKCWMNNIWPLLDICHTQKRLFSKAGFLVVRIVTNLSGIWNEVFFLLRQNPGVLVSTQALYYKLLAELWCLISPKHINLFLKLDALHHITWSQPPPIVLMQGCCNRVRLYLQLCCIDILLKGFFPTVPLDHGALKNVTHTGKPIFAPRHETFNSDRHIRRPWSDDAERHRRNPPVHLQVPRSGQ